ncbi:hypothetical protein [Saliphagus sp. LR7]|uniref:hypothetical protein n=1 Tax=Saliphagus sp. LR7 TaxID=2282654 RepID=UPI000DF73541|nr:hypothetical protein [Saliphagus sp. LR7]
MDTGDDFELSRRKALAGLGTIGVASVGVGIGTTAYLDDEEFEGNTIADEKLEDDTIADGERSEDNTILNDGFEDNTIADGEFGLTITPGSHRIDQDCQSQHVQWPTPESDAFVRGSIDIVDTKPGDALEFCWEATVHETPGYVTVSAENVDHLDGSETDAGVDADDLYDTDELETLAENVDPAIRIYEDYDSSTMLWEEEYADCETFLDLLQDGIDVDSDGEAPLLIDVGETVIVCIYLDISTEVSNEIQGAESSWDLLFYGEQARHNDDPTGL